MKRRTLIGSLPIGLLSLSGCLGNPIYNTQANTAQTNDNRTTKNTETTNSTTNSSPTQKQIKEFTADFKVLKGKWPAPEETVSADFNCEKLTATIIGWSTRLSGCHDLVFKSLDYNEKEDTINIVLTSKWGARKPPKEVDCGGSTYKYQVIFKSEKSFPKTIIIVYQSPEGEVTNTFKMSSDRC